MSDTLDDVRLVAALHPLRQERETFNVPAGLTVAEIMARVQPDPILRHHSHVYIGPYYIPRANWGVVRPNPGTFMAVRAFVPPRGGGSGGGKDILRTILMIAVVAGAMMFGPALGAALGFSGSLAASVGQAVIGLGGMLLVNALVPPQTATSAATSAQADDPATQFITGAQNQANPFGPVPVLFGQVKVAPYYGAEAVTEIVGDDQYLRMLFVWGVGPMWFDPAKLKIGDTLIGNFDDVQIEHRYGYANDAPLTLYTGTIDEQDFQILLQNVDGYTIRTTSDNADEISVDIVFPSGLISIADDGTRSNYSVAIEIEYSVAGANSWASIPIAGGTRTFDLSWTNSNGAWFNVITFTQKKTSAVRHGLTWKTPARGQYDVRIARLTADTTSDQIQDSVQWTALRRIENIDPINSPVPVAKTAIRIRATDQLNGVINELTGVPIMVTLDWDIPSQTWIFRATQNPAAAYRHALQGAALQQPYADSGIDLAALQHWSEFCTTKGFKYNYWTGQGTGALYDQLAAIAAAGRATPQNIDGRWSVVIDEPKLPVSHVTPRNSNSFKASKAFVDPPHAFRVQFPNEQNDYAADEIRVYLNGYTAANATLFESMDFPGVTDPVQITMLARFMAAVGIQRPEQYTFNQDMERLVYRRGDVVLITHDVLLVGTTYGRVKDVETDDDGNALGVTLDVNLDMDGVSDYAISIRSVGNVALVAPVITIDGTTNTVQFVNPITAANAPDKGNLFGFGFAGLETDSILILDVSPNDGDLGAAITAVPYREEVYDVDSGAIPPFQSNITPIAPIPNVSILQVRSDETALTFGAGDSLNVQVAIKVANPGVQGLTLDARIRPAGTGEPYGEAQINAFSNNEVFIGDVRTAEYVDIQIRWSASGRIPGPWASLPNYRIIGKSTPPQSLQNMTISTFGGSAYIRWDLPPELDVQYGGIVQFRFSADSNPLWNNSTSIGDVAQAKSLLATLPLKSGTYIARVFDDAGNQSTVAMVNTAQASVLTYGPVSSITESPNFSGTLDDVIVDSIALRLEEVGEFWDEIPDVDSEDDMDELGDRVSYPTGTYTFYEGLDFGLVKNVRLTTRLQAGIASNTDNIDSWTTPIDARQDFDGSDSAEADCRVYVSMTNDDPNGASPTWTAFQRLDSSEISARGCRFKAVLTSSNTDYNISVTELGIDAEQVT